MTTTFSRYALRLSVRRHAPGRAGEPAHRQNVDGQVGGAEASAALNRLRCQTATFFPHSKALDLSAAVRSDRLCLGPR